MVMGIVSSEPQHSGSQDEHYVFYLLANIIYVTTGLCTTNEISQIVAGIVVVAHMQYLDMHHVDGATRNQRIQSTYQIIL